MNSYKKWIGDLEGWRRAGTTLPLGGFAPCARPELLSRAPVVLLFSPHPDDECVIGALPLRLLRERSARVINVAVTQGSKKERQAERWEELKNACEFLGFETVQTRPGGLEKISPQGRTGDPDHWSAAVQAVAGLLQQYQPRVIFLPHAQDWNGTHIGTHLLVIEALQALGNGPDCTLVETEFWAAHPEPNLMVECPAGDLADLVAALSFHVGEVRRNPYHLTLPAWMQDNVRRGGELVGGQGGAVPDFAFATLYRALRWSGGRGAALFAGGRILPAAAALEDLLP